MSQLKIGFLSFHNYLDKTSFSGIPYYMHRALSARDIELVNLGFPYSPNALHRKIEHKLQNAISKLQAPTMSIFTDSVQFKNFDAKVEQQLKNNPCDAIVAPVASSELNFLETNIPIIYISDATPKLIYQYYKIPETKEEFNIYEQRELVAILKSKLLIYSSQWAANSAVENYKAKPEQTKIIPFGANLDNPPDVADLHKRCQNMSPVRLLFVGVNWQRKGGIIAYETLLSLLDRGIDAELTIVGCTPPDDIHHERLNVIPFINKNVSEEYKRFNRLFLDSHFFLLPTRADCSPIVIGEASAFGLPSVTSDVGGLPALITEDKNGYILPFSAPGKDYADAIANQISSPQKYAQLVTTARQEYDTRLNWDSWAEKVHSAILEIIN
ncbi:MAG: glycosyltransferase family 4 protein [Spirulinaceae cyanobacterium]